MCDNNRRDVQARRISSGHLDEFKTAKCNFNTEENLLIVTHFVDIQPS